VSILNLVQNMPTDNNGIFPQFTQISDRSKKFKTLLNLQDKIERCSVKYTKIVVFNLYYAFQFGAFLARQLSQLFFSHCQYDQLIRNQTSFLLN